MPALPALPASAHKAAAPANARMPDFQRMHQNNSHKKVSIADHHAAKQARAHALTAQHHTIKTPTAAKTPTHGRDSMPLVSPAAVRTSFFGGSSHGAAKVLPRVATMGASKIPAPKAASIVSSSSSSLTVSSTLSSSTTALPRVAALGASKKENAPHAVNRAPTASGAFVRKEHVKAPAFGSSKPAVAAKVNSFNAPASSSTSAAAVQRVVKAPTFQTRDQKTALAIDAGKEKRNALFDEKRAKLAAIAEAAKAARERAAGKATFVLGAPASSSAAAVKA